MQINTTRINRDNHFVNRHGERLIELCKNVNLFIVNGRFGEDADVGKFTCKDCSVVDYTIVSTEVFNLLKNFVVADFNPILSDVHCPLLFTFSKRDIRNKIYRDVQSNIKPRWCEEKKDSFVHNLNIDEVNELLYFTRNCQSFTETDCNIINTKLCKIFQHCSLKTFGEPRFNKRPKRKGDKPWFGTDCRRARFFFNRARKKYNKIKNVENKTNMLSAGKAYRKTVNKYFNKHRRKFQNNIRHMHSKRPRDFWKLLNSIGNQNKTTDIDLNVLYTYFENVNSNFQEDTFELTNTDNDLLDQAITESEIRYAVKGLKKIKHLVQMTLSMSILRQHLIPYFHFI